MEWHSTELRPRSAPKGPPHIVVVGADKFLRRITRSTESFEVTYFLPQLHSDPTLLEGHDSVKKE